MFLPFIPGDYDGLAVTLSTMAQISGIAGLLLVPIGIFWLVTEIINKRKKDEKNANKTAYRFAIVSLIVSCIIAIAVSIGALIGTGPTFGILTFVACIYIVSKFIVQFLKMKKEGNIKFGPIPFYLICIPSIIVLIRFMFIIPATEFSRNHAIRQSEILIRDIESYYATHGHYPISLLSLRSDYKPSVIGIKQYRYEPFENAYNLCFEQFSYQIGVSEIVMYNKLDEQDISSHDTDLLVLAPDQINLQRGHLEVHDLPNPHWKYFWFD